MFDFVFCVASCFTDMLERSIYVCGRCHAVAAEKPRDGICRSCKRSVQIRPYACGGCQELFIAGPEDCACRGCTQSYCKACFKTSAWSRHKEKLMIEAVIAGKDATKVNPPKGDEWEALSTEEIRDNPGGYCRLKDFKTKCQRCTEVPSMYQPTDTEMLDFAFDNYESSGTMFCNCSFPCSRDDVKERIRQKMTEKLLALH